jgi:hypothetical protein
MMVDDGNDGGQIRPLSVVKQIVSSISATAQFMKQT